MFMHLHVKHTFSKILNCPNTSTRTKKPLVNMNTKLDSLISEIPTIHAANRFLTQSCFPSPSQRQIKYSHGTARWWKITSFSNRRASYVAHFFIHPNKFIIQHLVVFVNPNLLFSHHFDFCIFVPSYLHNDFLFEKPMWFHRVRICNVLTLEI